MGQLEHCRDEWETIVRLVRSATDNDAPDGAHWHALQSAAAALSHRLQTAAIVDGAINTTARARCLALLDAMIADVPPDYAPAVLHGMENARRALVRLPSDLLTLHARRTDTPNA